MDSLRYPLRDVQQDPPVRYCIRCDGEIYDPDNTDGLCDCCRDDLYYGMKKKEVKTQ